MAFPTVVNTNVTAVATASTTHNINLPASLVAGNLILIVTNKGLGGVTFNALTGWTELIDETSTAGGAMWYRVSDGAEGATVTFTSSGSTRSASIAYQISGAINPATQAPQLSTVATGTSANPNATTCTPTGGAKDYLWITTFGQAGEQADTDTLTTVTPTGFTNVIRKTCGTAGTDLGGMVAAAQQQLNAASLDATAWTSSDATAWRAYTIAIHPAPPTAAASFGFAAAATGTIPVEGVRAVYMPADHYTGISSGANKAIPNVAYQAGDRVTVWGWTEDALFPISAISNPTGLTFSAVSAATIGSGGEGSECPVFCWSGVASASASGQTINLTNGGPGSCYMSGYCQVQGGDGGIANAAANRDESLFGAFTPTAGSTVTVVIIDWLALSGYTGVTATGTLTERLDLTNGTNIGMWIGTWEGVTASSTQFGTTDYTGRRVTQSVLELKKVASGGDVDGFAAAAFVTSAVGVGGPAGSASSSLTFGASGAGVATTPEVNGTAVAARVWTAGATGQAAVQGAAVAAHTFTASGAGGPAGVAVGARTWSAGVVGEAAIPGAAVGSRSWTAAGAGGPAGTANVGVSWLAGAAGQATGSDINGSAAATLTWGGQGVGSPAGSASVPNTFSATVAGVDAAQGGVVAPLVWSAASSGVVGVGGAATANRVWSAQAVGAPAGSVSTTSVWTATAAGQPARQGASAATFGFAAGGAGGAAGTASAPFNFLASGSGTGGVADANGQASTSLVWGGTVAGFPAVQGAAVGTFAFQGQVIGQLAGSAGATFNFSAASIGVVGLSGVVSVSFGGAAVANGTPTVVGAAAAPRTFAAVGQGGAAGTAVGSLTWASVASGRVDVVGRAVGAFSFGAAGTGDAAGGSSLGVLGDRLNWHTRPEGHGPSDGVDVVRQLPVRADRHTISVPPRG